MSNPDESNSKESIGWEEWPVKEIFQAVRSETRDPLSIGKAYCELLLSQRPGDLTDKQIEMIKYIYKALDGTDTLIQTAFDEIKLRIRQNPDVDSLLNSDEKK